MVPQGSAQARARPASSYAPALADFIRTTDLEDTQAYLAWQLSQMATAASAAERDTLALLVARLLVAEGQGSTRLALEDEDRPLVARLPELVGPAGGDTPLVMDGDHLYTHRSHACERRVAVGLAERLGQSPPFAPEAVLAALGEVMATAEPPPSREQAGAVAHALARRLGVISGGPGTGKTTTALTLVRCLSRLDVAPSRIALCAPTGKAASRMEDDFRRRLASMPNPHPTDGALLRECPKAQTLHRLLGLSSEPGTLRRPKGASLPYRAVVVDECSMVDLVLMDALLSALPADAVLVLLGDADQLPSVAAGSVFRDLGRHATRLERGFRTAFAGSAGAELARLAAAIRAGDDTALALCASRASASELRYEGAERLAGERRGELLRAHHRRHFAGMAELASHVFTAGDGGFASDDVARLEALAAGLVRSRILTVTRERTTGAAAANAFLHELCGGGPGFLPGEPVLMLRNDYRRELWNGSQGVAILLRQPGRPVEVAVAFPSRSGWQAVDPEAVGGALEHAFALTTHKSQGSELDEVLFLLPDSPCPVLTRELLYTGISRARHSAVLCGSTEMIAVAMATQQPRDSGLASRLDALLASGQP